MSQNAVICCALKYCHNSQKSQVQHCPYTIKFNLIENNTQLQPEVRDLFGFYSSILIRFHFILIWVSVYSFFTKRKDDELFYLFLLNFFLMFFLSMSSPAVKQRFGNRSAIEISADN